MKRIFTTLFVVGCLISCKVEHPNSNSSNGSIEGTWQLVYGSIKEKDTLIVKDLSNTSFIKIINTSHFAFFNQAENDASQFYGGAGTYTFDGTNYIEKLTYTSALDFKGHEFPFTIEIKGDTLIQSGIEKIDAAGIYREILEKYIKIKP